MKPVLKLIEKSIRKVKEGKKVYDKYYLSYGFDIEVSKNTFLGAEYDKK